MLALDNGIFLFDLIITEFIAIILVTILAVPVFDIAVLLTRGSFNRIYMVQGCVTALERRRKERYVIAVRITTTISDVSCKQNRIYNRNIAVRINIAS